MSMKEPVKETIDLVRGLLKISELIKEQRGGKNPLSLESMISPGSDQRYQNAREEVVEYLVALGSKKLLKLKALIYSGRGDGTYFEMLEYFEDELVDDRITANIIVQKSISVEDYLTKAESLLKEDGLELDDL